MARKLGKAQPEEQLTRRRRQPEEQPSRRRQQPEEQPSRRRQQPVEQPSRRRRQPEEPQQKTALFGNLFGGKPKRNATYDEYDDSNTPTEKEPPVRKRGRSINTDNTVIEQPRRKSSLSDGSKELILNNQNHMKPSEKAIQANYTQKSLNQYVFMYMTPRYFGNALKFYNKNFENITVLGTSAINELMEVFSKKTICNALLLFAFYQNEVEYLYLFLKKIGLRNLDRRILNIFLVSRDGVDVSKITEDNELKKYISRAEPLVLDETHPLTISMLERAMSGIVQNQPVYIEEEPLKQPKKAVVKETPISKIYKVDIAEIQRQVEEIKQRTGTTEEHNKLVKSVLSAKNDKGLDDAILNAEHIKFIKDVEDELDVYIDQFQNNECLRSELEEMASNKLLLSALRTAEVKNLMESLVERAKQRLDSQDALRDDFNRTAIQELNEAKADAEVLKSKRAEILKVLDQKCMEYKGYIQLITNSYTIEERCEVEEFNALCKLVENVKGKITSTNISVISDFTKKLKVEIDRNREAKCRADDRLINMLKYQKSIFTDMKALVEVDTILIKKLSDIISEYQEEAEIKRYTETKLQAIGVNILAIDESGFDTLFRMIGSSRDMFLYISTTQPVISKNQFSLDEFLDANWEIVDKPVIYIDPNEYFNELKSRKYIDRVLNKLDYYAKNFNNIFIVTRVPSSEAYLTNELSVAAIQFIGNIVYFTSAENNKAVAVNMLHQDILKTISKEDIYSIKIVINKTPKDFSKDTKSDFKAITGLKCKDLCVAYKDNIESSISEKTLQKLKGLKQSIR